MAQQPHRRSNLASVQSSIPPVNLNWVNSKDGTLGQPMIGQFKNGRGEFGFCRIAEEHLCVYAWQLGSPNLAFVGIHRFELLRASCASLEESGLLKHKLRQESKRRTRFASTLIIPRVSFEPVSSSA